MPQYNSYYLYQKMIKYDGQDWIPSYPAAYSEDGVDTMPLVKKMDNDPACGYEPVVTPIYRWVDVTYNPSDSSTYMCDECPHDYSTDYLTFVAQESGSFSFSSTSGNSIQYSLDSGLTWSTASSAVTTPTISANQKVLWKGAMTPSTSYPNLGIGIFSSTGAFTVEGNAHSLLWGDNFSGQTDLSGKNYAFAKLFNGCTTLTSAENMVLPATTLANYCYAYMFYGCTSLTTAPQLPATTLADDCYLAMFAECTSLTTAPQLPATTLEYQCYYGMFRDCSGLTTAPQLPATTLANWCYSSMFQGCTSLTTAPSLPATSLTQSCYNNMFCNCTSLTTAPVLSATTLAERCYAAMFDDCTSLTTAPELPATTLESSCYQAMFRGCTSLTTAPVLSATTLVYYCYDTMFIGCSSLSAITCLATDRSASNCTGSWVSGVSASGTFTKAANMTEWGSCGTSRIPCGWTVQDYS